MAWQKSRADRQRDAANYGVEYRRARAAAIKRADGQCEQVLDSGQRCGSRDRCQVDHITPISQGGTHNLDNLRVLCRLHHGKKTAQEGKGYRRPGAVRTSDPLLEPRTNW